MKFRARGSCVNEGVANQAWAHVDEHAGESENGEMTRENEYVGHARGLGGLLRVP